jgi:hypothetical protein
MRVLRAANKSVLLAALLLGMLAVPAGRLSADEARLEVRPAGSRDLEIEPRNTITSVFSVSNYAFREIDVSSNLELPEGWNLVATDFVRKMYGEDRAISLVSIYVPRTAMAGRYRIRYAVSANQYPSMQDSCAIRVDVLPTVKLALMPIETPTYAIAGEPYRAILVVANRGNTTAQVTLRLETMTELNIVFDPATIQIPPGESAPVVVSIETDPGLKRRLSQRLIVVAELAGSPDTRARATISVEVVPRISIMEDRYYRTPATLALRYVGETDGIAKSRLQTELVGGGALDAGGHRNTSFRVLTPDSHANGVLGQPDEYFFSYWTDRYEISLGDQGCSVSQLIEPNRYGLAAKAGFKNGGLRVSTHHLQTRWDEPREEQTAVTVDLPLGQDVGLGVNYLAKTRLETSHILGLEGRFAPIAGTDLELEYAAGLGDHADQEDYRAYRANLKLAGKGVSSLLRLIHAGPSFPGYYNNVEFVASSLTVTPLRDLRLEWSLRQERHNMSLDPDLHSALEDRGMDFGANYRLCSATDLFVGYRRQHREDRLSTSGYHSSESTLRSGTAHRAGRWDVYAGIEAGRMRDVSAAKAFDLRRYNLSFSVRAMPRQTYRGYLFYEDNGATDSATRQHLTAGVSGNVRLFPGTSLEVSLKSDHFRHSTDHNRSTIRTGVSQTVRGNATLRLEGYYGIYQDGVGSDKSGIMLELAVPLGLPLSAKPDFGSLKGRVYDTETGEAIPEVVLKVNGSTAVTNHHGVYVFPSLKAGAYTLDLDRATIGLNRVTILPLPIEVAIQPGERGTIDIGVTRNASIRGEVFLYNFEKRSIGREDQAAGDLVRGRGLANALIELALGAETKYVLTDRAGRFQFADLRPGSWSLKIRSDDLPENHYIENDILEIEAMPGEMATVAVRVLPKYRQVHMLKDGGVLEEESRR